MSEDDVKPDFDATLPPLAFTEGADLRHGTADSGPVDLSESPIPLGVFDLCRFLGRGGEAEVWWGQHREEALGVAIKVMRSGHAQDEQYRARFNAEVRAVAALDHPGIVSILDYGVIDGATAQRSDGRLTEGCPYLVMEYAEAGDLKTLLPLATYAEFRGVMLEILQGLAHAHARGVIHRDIKPGNILARSWRRSSPGLLLADFGIAHAVSARKAESESESDAAEDRRLVMGTPTYMAPEQICADMSNHGPWTDLYAVGCLAYQLATGRLPFRIVRGDMDAVLEAHLHGLVPDPQCRFPVPGGLAEWLNILLAKAPWDRYQRAADAMHALVALGDAPVKPALPSASAPDPEVAPKDVGTETNTVAAATPRDEDYSHTIRDDAPLAVMKYTSSAAQPSDAPRSVAPLTFPSTWRTDRRGRQPVRLVGAGLQLFGLRTVPFVGRDRERDLLWQDLRSVAQEKRPRLVLLQGAAGVGKSRLAQWLTWRSDELGWAEIMTATHSAFPTGVDGLPHMLAQALRCHGLTRKDASHQTRHVLNGFMRQQATSVDSAELEYLVMAFTAILSPFDGEDERATQSRGRSLFASQGARFAVIQKLIRYRGSQRPVILWLDDVQWGLEGLALAKHLMRCREDTPVLILMTARDEALRERAAESREIEALLAQERTRTLSLPKLLDHEQLDLILGTLGLEPPPRKTSGHAGGWQPPLRDPAHRRLGGPRPA